MTILDNASTYGAIPAQGTGSGDTFLFTLSPSALCGQSLKFTLQTVSTLGTTTVDFVVRVGDPTGTGAPVTYTRTIPSGLAIPDADLTGATDTLTITDDLEISDLNFRVDSLTHTFTGDLTVGFKAPNGYGTDLAYLRGFFIGDGDGDDFVNTLFDDASSNDLNLSGEVDAPYTGDWSPAFNSVIWTLFGIPNLGPDPVGQLSRLNGLSTQGAWKVHLTDQAALRHRHAELVVAHRHADGLQLHRLRRARRRHRHEDRQRHLQRRRHGDLHRDPHQQRHAAPRPTTRVTSSPTSCRPASPW